MKQVIFLFVLSAYLISCSSSKNIQQESLHFSFDTAGYYSNPFVAKYRNSPGFIPPEKALTYIDEFRNHIYKSVFRKKRLRVAWTVLDQATLKTVMADPTTDSVVFYLGAFPKFVNVPQKYRKTPFVLMQVKPKLSNLTKSPNYIFFGPRALPTEICPPPKSGCKVLFVESSALH